MKRIGYYESIYSPLQDEKFWLCVDSTANRILDERPCEGSPYYPAIREIVVSVWVHSLYLARHGQTEFNVQGRIGGDPPLTALGPLPGRSPGPAHARPAHRLGVHLHPPALPRNSGPAAG